MSPSPDSPAFLNAYLGRNSGPELFASVTHTSGAVNQVVVPKNITPSRPIEALIFNWRGRVVIGTADYTTIAPEGPQNILDRIIVTGVFKNAQLTPINLSGATAFALMRCSQVEGNSIYNGTTKAAQPTSPFAVPTGFGAQGTFDLDIYWTVPVYPLVAKANRAIDQVPYLWQPQDWANTLQIQVNLGDKTSFGTPAGGTTVTFSAIGGATGSPVLNIYTRMVSLGPLRGGFKTACLIRNEVPASGVVSAIANQQRLQLLQNQKTTRVLVKSGINLTGVTAGVHVYSSLSDTILDVTQLQRDMQPIRNNQDTRVFKESTARQFDTVLPQGYLDFSFIDGQSSRSAFRADLPSIVNAFEVYTNIVSANANNKVELIQEQIYAENGDPAWAATR